VEVIRTEEIPDGVAVWDSHPYNPTMVFRYLGIQVFPDEGEVEVALYDPKNLQWQKFAITEWQPCESPRFYPIAEVRKHINLWPKAVQFRISAPAEARNRQFKVAYDAPHNQIDYVLRFAIPKHFFQASPLLRIVETVDAYTVPLPYGFLPERISNIHVKSPDLLPVPGAPVMDLPAPAIVLNDPIPEGLAILHFLYAPLVEVVGKSDFYQVTQLPCICIRPVEIGDRRRLSGSDSILAWTGDKLEWSPLYCVDMTLELSVHAEKSSDGLQDAHAIAKTALARSEEALYCPPHDLWVPMQPISHPDYDSDGALNTLKFRVKLLNLVEGEMSQYLSLG